MFSAICLSIVLVGVGLAMIFARDFMWGLTEWGNQTRGVQSERTEWWDTSQVLSGIALIVIGIIMALILISQENESRQHTENATATFVAQHDRVVQYGTPIATLQNVAAGDPQRISGSALGLNASTVFYGRCEGSDGFYALLYDPTYDYKALAYASSGTIYECVPDGIHVSQVDNLGDGWYSLWTSEKPSTLMTSVARMNNLKTPDNVLTMYAPATKVPIATPAAPSRTPDVRTAVPAVRTPSGGFFPLLTVEATAAS